MSSYTERFVMSKIITLRKWFLGDLKRFFKAFFVLTSCSRFLQVHSFFKSFFYPKLYICLWFYVQYAEDLESGFSSDVESKYKKIYEDDINPFAAFSKKVAQLGYSSEAQQIFFFPIGLHILSWYLVAQFVYLMNYVYVETETSTCPR